jgi:hypothetical protein
VRIENPLQLALEFVERDGSYRAYDLAPVAHDNVLTESDIRVANAMIARMSPRVMAGIFAQAPTINVALGRIPPSASLAAADDAIPWRSLEELMRAMDGIPEVKLARQTKVLHKKRPGLIPVLDSVVETYLRQVDRPRRTGDPARDALELIRSYKRELDANLTAIQALRGELRAHDIDLTECRLLDLFIWAYSGTYTPLFRRNTETTTGSSPRQENVAHSAATGASATGKQSTRQIEVELFRDNDEGYLAWLAAHPTGFVLNLARTPRPNYLILHRASCRTISGRPTRGGPWTGPYIKVCADDDLQIAAWTGHRVGATPTRCRVCLPTGT